MKLPLDGYSDDDEPFDDHPNTFPPLLPQDDQYD